MDNRFKRVLVTGGAGYVGSSLVPKLLDAGYAVSVLDLYLYGEDLFKVFGGNSRLREIRGDLRDPGSVGRSLEPAYRTILRSISILNLANRSISIVSVH